MVYRVRCSGNCPWNFCLIQYLLDCDLSTTGVSKYTSKKKTKSPNGPPETFGMQQSRSSCENRNYSGLDATKVDNVKNIYEVNIATGDIVTSQSSNYNDKWVSSKAVDGCTRQIMTHGCCSHTGLGQTEAWWRVDLRRQSIIERVEIIYRDERALARLAGFEIYLSDTSDWTSRERCYQDNTASLELMTAIQNVTCVGVGQYVTIYNDRRVKAKSWYWNEAYFELCEVYVFGCTLGKFGNGHCNDDCLNCLNNVCQPTSGACECDVGFYGDHCDQICPLYCKNNVCKMSNGQCVECDVGFFGNHCDQLCPGNCENHTCNKDSGLCTECISGFYGNVCNQACPDNCGNNVCSMQDGQCLIPLPERQTGDTCSYVGFYTGYAVLGAFLGISVCFNICLIVLFLRQAKKTKSPNEPPGTFGMHTIRKS